MPTEPPPVLPPILPDILPYVLEDKIGRGSQAVTWRARHRETGEAVAVKVFRLADAEDWKAHELFLRECEVLRSLDHPGIPRFVAAHGEPERGELYLVTELVPGRSLDRAVRSGHTFSHADLYPVLRQCLDILEHLHGRTPPIIHRDIKPGNLVMTPHGRVKLVDFGGVRVALRPDGGSTMVGTFGYLAPEQLQGQATPASDIYSLGVTLAVLASGVEAEDLPRAGLRLDLGGVVTPGPLLSLIERMTEPDPDDRLDTVAATRQAMERRQLPGSIERFVRGPRQRGGGIVSWLWRVVLFLVWMAASAGHAVTGVVARALPRSYSRKRARLESGSPRSARRRERKLARLERKHERRMRALEVTRTGLRAIVDRSEPYAGHGPSRPGARATSLPPPDQDTEPGANG